MNKISILFILTFALACEQRTNKANESTAISIDTVRFGNYYGSTFHQDIASLELQNPDSSHLFKLINDSTHFVRIELGKLSKLNLQLVSKNPNVAVTKLDQNTFKLAVNKQTDEADNYYAQLALLNTYKTAGYVLIRRDTTLNSETFSETQPFAELDTIVHYSLKIK